VTLETQTVHPPGGPSFLAVVDTQDGFDPVAEEMTRGRSPLAASWPLLRSLLRTSATALDLGAHQGAFALAAAVLGCRVLAVEASPANVELLRQSARLNRLERMEVVHAAVFDRTGELTFRALGPFGSVVLGDPGGDPAMVRVPAIRVDALVAQHRLETVDFVKMDVEGSESAAVRGMAGLLSGSPAPIVFYESNGHTLDFYDESCQGLKAAFANLGYRSFYVDVVRARLVPVEPDDLQPDCFVDYLAIKPGSYEWHDGPGARIGSWPVAAPLTPAEWRSWLRSVCRDDLPQLEVAHVVRQFASGPDWVRRDRVASEFVARHRG
jgi:FkbM family methyltransferase